MRSKKAAVQALNESPTNSGASEQTGSLLSASLTATRLSPRAQAKARRPYPSDATNFDAGGPDIFSSAPIPLEKLSYFARFGSDFFDACIETLTWVPFHACEVVFAKNDPVQQMVIVSAGRLEYLFQKMSIPVRPGDCLADHEIFSDLPRHLGTLLTTERAEVYTMLSGGLKKLLHQFPLEADVLKTSAQEQMFTWERSANIMIHARDLDEGSDSKGNSDAALLQHRLVRLDSVHLRILDLLAMHNISASPNA